MKRKKKMPALEMDQRGFKMENRSGLKTINRAGMKNTGRAF